ncbi:copper homeostasis protein CutC [Reichenbachiella agarivorans]|uniref:PF03932 family protein CutC n=1 Tax=Reichenbachiella agarivorans TaxID=2979464 RepID=A0ABY6CS63_9BACT|nr:copper homeostasis protein CutC [Reichenbachiella agarivorans]UXP33347.1 copper homeostasis protein CutC [Reichenbachiella agarivorans]
MSPSKKIILEVCIDSVASAINAQAGGASRVELCDNLAEGGTTPSAGMIKMVRDRLSIDMQVIIRPRVGDFLYTQEEFDVMKEDIKIAKSLGANGVVIGCLLPDGSIDMIRTQELVTLARPMNVTFHRAFDMVADAAQALEDLIRLGVERVLTSGLENDVVSGSTTLTRLILQAGDRIIVMPGGGVRLENAKTLIATTKAKEIHVSGRHTLVSQMTFQNPKVKMGILPDKEYQIQVVDQKLIQRFIQLLNP